MIREKDYLMHYGIKGMKWGVRRARKKEAKERYRNAKIAAKEELKNARYKADKDYNKAMSKKNNELKKINDKYDSKLKANDSYYSKEIDKVENRMSTYKTSMDLLKSGLLYEENKRNYDKAVKEYIDVQDRYSRNSEAIEFARDREKIKVYELYAESTNKAEVHRNQAYQEAGESYIQALRSAKLIYKKEKKS